MSREVALTAICAVSLIACGEATAPSSAPDAVDTTAGVLSEPSPVSAPEPPQAGPFPSVEESGDVRDVTAVDGHALRIPVLGVERPDPRLSTPLALPDFVLAAEYWVVDDTYAVGAIIQNEIPRYLPDELVDVVNSNGVTWSVYVSEFEGPHVTSAVSVVDGIAYTVAVNSLGAELPDPTPLEVLLKALPSVLVAP